MKRLLIMLISFVMLAGVAFADDWHATNQITVRWDAVATLSNGNPIPDGDVVTYDLYVRSVQTNVEFLVVPGISGVESSITFQNEGDYHIGIRTVRTVPAVGELPARNFPSIIGWSSDPLIVKDGITFGVSYYIPMAGVGGLHIP